MIRFLLSIIISILLVGCGGIDGTGGPDTGSDSGGQSSSRDAQSDRTQSESDENDEDKTESKSQSEGQKAPTKESLKKQTHEPSTNLSGHFAGVSRLTGPITHIMRLNESTTLTVLEQKLVANPSIPIGGSASTLVDLMEGDIVSVNGFEIDGTISATRIDRIVSVDRYHIFGAINKLDAKSQRFQLNALVVDYSQLRIPVTLTEASNVRVSGTEFDLDGVFIATKIELTAYQQ